MSKAFVSGAELRLENEIFDGFRSDMNVIIRELLRNMIARGSEDGKITATIEVALFPEYTETGTTLQPHLDEKTNTYYLQHIKGKPQMSIYDMDGYEEE